MRIALAQINTTVGDFSGNLARIRHALDRGRREEVDVIVFPELAIPGYPSEDLLEREDFLREIEASTAAAVAATKDIGMVLGTVGRANGGDGPPIHNSALFARDGRIIHRQDKSLLPTYDVFDEARYFRPASARSAVEIGGRRAALLVCEDLWNDAAFWEERRYAIDPVAELIETQQVELILAISASPYSVGKPEFRYHMLRHTALRFGVEIAYTNLVGGNTTLIFDGGSMAFDRRGRLLAMGKLFDEDFVVFDTETESRATSVSIPFRSELPRSRRSSEPAPYDPDAVGERELEEIFDALVLGTRDFLHKSGFDRALIGLSGGIDSALVAVIAARALGAENVTGVALPSRYSSKGSIDDAEALASALGIELLHIPIEETFQATLETLAPVFAGLPQDVTEENLQARVRGLLLMALSNKRGAMLLATGNKSELATGYCTLYGDMAGGLAVIGDVPKLLVYRLSRWIHRKEKIIPLSTIEKPPSAELRPNQRDQDTLPPYEILDPILHAYIEERQSIEAIVDLGYERATVERVARWVHDTEYKRKQAAPILRVTSKAFGPGRRFPIVERFRRQS
ncbi:MAG TPA: NAD+ synthase [Planctomycetota bacterium]|nr:NAD+ synthase [Planctomycetota bacterium]